MAERVPAPLAALLGIVAILGLTWALVLPAFQAPDENSHFGYVQSLVEHGALPGDQGRELFSSEQRGAAAAVDSDQTAGSLLTRPTWSRAAYDRWRAADARLPRRLRADGGGPNPASSNPPLYYVYEALPYVVDRSGDVFGRLVLMRLFSVLWLLVTVAGAWLLGGEVFGRDRRLQLATAAVPALLPMMTFVSGSVTPDSMLYALWSLVLWLGVRALRRGLTVLNAVSLLGVTGLACVVKATSYGLLPAVALVVLVGLWRVRPRVARRVALLLAVAVVAFAIPAGGWYATARVGLDRPAAQRLVGTGSGAQPFNARRFGSYLWQYYLPRLGFMNRPAFRYDYPLFEVWIQGAWGSFGWLEVQFPDGIYMALAVLSGLIAIAGLAAAFRRRNRGDPAVPGFFTLVAVVLLAALHWTDYHYVLDGNNFNQGRYLLPLAPLGGVLLAWALTWLRPARRLVGVGVVVGGLLALQVASLALVMARFYA